MQYPFHWSWNFIISLQRPETVSALTKFEHFIKNLNNYRLINGYTSFSIFHYLVNGYGWDWSVSITLPRYALFFIKSSSFQCHFSDNHNKNFSSSLGQLFRWITNSISSESIQKGKNLNNYCVFNQILFRFMDFNFFFF